IVKGRKGVGIALTAVGSFLILAGWNTPKGSLVWEHCPEAPPPCQGDHCPPPAPKCDAEGTASAKAKADKRPMIVHFTATWCVACQELATHTFSDPRVQAKAAEAKFVAVKV